MTPGEKPRRRGAWWQRAVAGVSVSGLVAGGAALYRGAKTEGGKDEAAAQMRRDIDRLRAEHERLVWTLFRLTAPPPGPGGSP